VDGLCSIRLHTGDWPGGCVFVCPQVIGNSPMTIGMRDRQFEKLRWIEFSDVMNNSTMTAVIPEMA
jgi:hypothetical protein